jgi:hypothetical protein
MSVPGRVEISCAEHPCRIYRVMDDQDKFAHALHIPHPDTWTIEWADSGHDMSVRMEFEGGERFEYLQDIGLPEWDDALD